MYNFILKDVLLNCNNIINFFKYTNLYNPQLLCKNQNFYLLYEMLYGKTGKFKAHTMKYYPKNDIDILTKPVSYTLISLFNLYESISKLAEELICVVDLNEDNVLLTEEGIIVTDTDLYYRNTSLSSEKIKIKNLSALRFLFKTLYFNSLEKYHSDIDNEFERRRIHSLFGVSGALNAINVSKILNQYERPIDYITKR